MTLLATSATVTANLISADAATHEDELIKLSALCCPIIILSPPHDAAAVALTTVQWFIICALRNITAEFFLVASIILPFENSFRDTAPWGSLFAEEDERLFDITKDSIKQALGINNEDLENGAKLMKAISCNDCDLTGLISHPKSTLGSLDSNDTPIFRRGLDIILPPIIYEVSVPPSKNAKEKSFFDVLMGKEVLNLKYLQNVQDADKAQEIDEQSREKVYDLYKEIGLGYDIPRQSQQLEMNAMHVKNAMCFIQKH